MNWKTIKEDGHPKPGTFVLCEVVKQFNQWSPYHVYYYGKRNGFPAKAFWLYDLHILDKDIVRYCEIE